uniref:Uncharacterized protein n=1 Tax=Glossina palpalis gambiensis TaxID=67801 RepID=A0A1B0BVH3_9MUSC
MFNVRRNLPDFKVTKSENLAWRSCLQITFSYGIELGFQQNHSKCRISFSFLCSCHGVCANPREIAIKQQLQINGLATLNTFEAGKRKTEKLETKSKKLHRPAAAASTYCVMQLHDCVTAIQSHPRPDKAARPSIERRNSNLVRLPVVSSYCNRSVNLLTPGEQYEICILHVTNGKHRHTNSHNLCFALCNSTTVIVVLHSINKQFKFKHYVVHHYVHYVYTYAVYNNLTLSYIKRTYARLMIYNSAIHILPVEQHHSDLEEFIQMHICKHTR